MTAAQTIYEKIITEHLDIIFQSTLVFFVMAIILLVILSFIQIIMEKRRQKVSERKAQYAEQISHYLFFDENNITVNGRDDYFALADAITELHSFVNKKDYHKVSAIIKAFDLDLYLLKRYQKGHIKLIQRFLLSKLFFIFSPRLKDFYREQLSSDTKNFEMTLYAVFSFADQAESSADLLLILHTLENNYDKGISQKFCEFVFTQAFENAPTEEVLLFLKKIQHQQHATVFFKSIISAIGDIQYHELQEEAHTIFLRFYKDNLFVVTYLRMLYSLDVHDCDFVKDLYLNDDPLIRINLSKYALSLCPQAFEELYIYMFDSNYYVRRNFFEALKEVHISRSQIEKIVQQRSPKKLNDRFFLDALNSFYPKAAA